MQSSTLSCFVTLMMSDKADAETLSNTWGKGNGTPCTETAVKDIWVSEQMELAKVLKLV